MESPFYTHLKQQLIGIKQSEEKLPPEEQAKLNEDIKRLWNTEPIDELSVEGIKLLQSKYNIKITLYKDKNITGISSIKAFENHTFKKCGSFTKALEIAMNHCNEKSKQGRPGYIEQNSKGTFYAKCPEKGAHSNTKSRLDEGLTSTIDSKGYISMKIEYIDEEET